MDAELKELIESKGEETKRLIEETRLLIEETRLQLLGEIASSAVETRKHTEALLDAHAADDRRQFEEVYRRLESTATELRSEIRLELKATTADMRHQFELFTERIRDYIRAIVEPSRVDAERFENLDTMVVDHDIRITRLEKKNR
jgi:hypothetical protein